MPYGTTQGYLLLPFNLEPGSGDFPTVTAAEAGTRFSHARLSRPGWWLYPKIVYLRNMVTYLRNNRAVSCLGVEPTTECHKSNAVLTITPPSYIDDVILCSINY